MTQLSPLLWSLTPMMFSLTLLLLMTSMWWKEFPSFGFSTIMVKMLWFKKWKW